MPVTLMVDPRSRTLQTFIAAVWTTIRQIGTHATTVITGGTMK